ncbi:MAG: hypothetical protein WDM92_16660 [Caulobacteraceae bacterium]
MAASVQPRGAAAEDDAASPGRRRLASPDGGLAAAQGPLPTAAAIEAARLLAFGWAVGSMAESYRTLPMETLRSLGGAAFEPLRGVPFVALAVLMRACPEVEAWRLARLLGLSPRAFPETLAHRRTLAVWPGEDVIAGLAADLAAGLEDH